MKTCVVFGTFQLGTGEWNNIFETDVFGSDCYYATAKDVIDAICSMHRKAGSKFHITNVVIG